jgi:hypothetical protein
VKEMGIKVKPECEHDAGVSHCVRHSASEFQVGRVEDECLWGGI